MKLYNKGYIIAGIVVFVIAITIPFWYGRGKDNAPPVLNLKTPAITAMAEKLCIEDTEFMRTDHMKLLVNWRDQAVRQGNRRYVAKNGKVYEISLTGTCLQCHSNKEEFCDRCHNYVGAKPNCWSCHNIPPLQKASGYRQVMNAFCETRDVAFLEEAAGSYNLKFIHGQSGSTGEVKK
jgi:hypothetical protein